MNETLTKGDILQYNTYKLFCKNINKEPENIDNFKKPISERLEEPNRFDFKLYEIIKTDFYRGEMGLGIVLYSDIVNEEANGEKLFSCILAKISSNDEGFFIDKWVQCREYSAIEYTDFKIDNLQINL